MAILNHTITKLWQTFYCVTALVADYVVHSVRAKDADADLMPMTPPLMAREE